MVEWLQCHSLPDDDGGRAGRQRPNQSAEQKKDERCEEKRAWPGRPIDLGQAIWQHNSER